MNGSSGCLDYAYTRSSSYVPWVSRERTSDPSQTRSRGLVHRSESSYRRRAYNPHGFRWFVWTRRDSNPGHPPCKGGTLPLSYEPDESLGSSKVPGRTRGPSDSRKVGPPEGGSRSIGGDPAADSPTATLLRLKPPCGAQIRPSPDGLIRTPLGCFDGRCVQGAGTYSPPSPGRRLLPNPASCGRVAVHNPNYDRVSEITAPSRGGNPLSRPL